VIQKDPTAGGRISNLSAVEKATQATLERFRRIDILINNAAIVGPTRKRCHLHYYCF